MIRMKNPVSFHVGPWVPVVLAFVLAACSSTPDVTPQGAVNIAVAQLNDAQRHYVSDYDPQALRQAREKLAEARKALGGEDPQQARDLAQESVLLVQVGTIKAELARTIANRDKVQRHIDALKALAGEQP